MGIKEKHYVYGSGMAGCLYDFGPHFTSNKDDAVNSILDLFRDSISEKEYQKISDFYKENDGTYYFSDPAEAGAQLCTISEENGPCPDENSE